MNEDRGQGQKHQLGKVGGRPYWVLSLSVVIRALHQIGAAVFLTAYLFHWGDELPFAYTILAVITGFVLVFTEWLRHRQLYREVAGVVTMSKCLLLGAAIHGFFPAIPLIVLAFVLASLGAHAPKNIRHRLLY